SLCPGYVEVDSFGPDDEYEDEEEIAYVTLDLGNVEPTLVPSVSSYRLIGLDTPTPYLQLAGTIFKGHHTSLLGSELLFTDAQHDVVHKRSISHVGTTDQRISFKEVRLQPKGASDEDLAAPTPMSKGKEKELRSLGSEQLVDRMTGKFVPEATPRSRARDKGKK
ncbi:hypothetical protein FISHEDRAFT_18212, partial [Fistulina hepatica ATCC 64428]